MSYLDKFVREEDNSLEALSTKVLESLAKQNMDFTDILIENIKDTHYGKVYENEDILLEDTIKAEIIVPNDNLIISASNCQDTTTTKEVERQSMSELSDYMKNYSHLTFDEYKRIKSGETLIEMENKKKK